MILHGLDEPLEHGMNDVIIPQLELARCLGGRYDDSIASSRGVWVGIFTHKDDVAKRAVLHDTVRDH